MDIITHAATGVLLSTAFEEPAAKAACIIGSIIPDISLAPVYYHIHRNRHKGLSLNSLGHPDKLLPEKILIPYRITHSFVPIILFLIGGLVTQESVITALCLGCFLHILWDIPTHTNQFASRPFYPFSHMKQEGFGDWWRSRTGIGLMIGSWLTLGGTYFMMT